jgi:hypothetical protein
MTQNKNSPNDHQLVSGYTKLVDQLRNTMLNEVRHMQKTCTEL